MDVVFDNFETDIFHLKVFMSISTKTAHPWPYSAKHARFVKFSDDVNNDGSEFLCLLGGFQSNETDFKQVVCKCTEATQEDTKQEVEDRAVRFADEDDMKKWDVQFRNFNFKDEDNSAPLSPENASLNNLCDKVKNGRGLISYLISNRYIITMTRLNGYSCYDCVNDEWIVKDDTENLQLTTDNGQCLLIDEKLLIVSEKRELFFYDLNDLKQPRLIDKKTLSIKTSTSASASTSDSEWDGYVGHGMCLLKVTKERDNWLIALLLFGGKSNVVFTESFLRVTVNVDLFQQVHEHNNHNHDSNTLFGDIRISSSKSIEISNMHDNIGYLKNDYLYRFSFVLLKNKNISDGDRIIVIIGGGGGSAISSSQDKNVGNILIFNYDKKQLISVLNDSDTSQEIKNKRLPLNCEFRAAARLHKNHIHCIYDKTHFMIWLDKLQSYFRYDEKVNGDINGMNAPLDLISLMSGNRSISATRGAAGAAKQGGGISINGGNAPPQISINDIVSEVNTGAAGGGGASVTTPLGALTGSEKVEKLLEKNVSLLEQNKQTLRLELNKAQYEIDRLKLSQFGGRPESQIQVDTQITNEIEKTEQTLKSLQRQINELQSQNNENKENKENKENERSLQSLELEFEQEKKKREELRKVQYRFDQEIQHILDENRNLKKVAIDEFNDIIIELFNELDSETQNQILKKEEKFVAENGYVSFFTTLPQIYTVSHQSLGAEDFCTGQDM